MAFLLMLLSVGYSLDRSVNTYVQTYFGKSVDPYTNLSNETLFKYNNISTNVHEDFENVVSSYWYLASNNYSYSGHNSTNYSASPTHSYRFELHSSDAPYEAGIRSELEGPVESPLQEGIYNFSTYLPIGGTEDWALDNPECGEIIAQWHQNPDTGDTVERCGPPLSLNIFTNITDNQSHYIVSSMYDTSSNTTESGNLSKNLTIYDLGPITKGQWVNWSFHLKWGWLASQHPFMRVYKNNILVINNTFPNVFNDKKGINQQLGIYKPEWDGSDPRALSKLTTRVIYFDDINTTLVNNAIPNGTGLVTNGLVAFYSGTLNGNTVSDLSGYNNIGYASNAFQGTNLSTGKKYILLYSANSHINVTSNSMTNLSSPLTIEFIGSINELGSYEPIVTKYSGTAGWFLCCSGYNNFNHIRFGAELNKEKDDNAYNSMKCVVPGQVYDIVVTYDNFTTHCYIDSMDSGIDEWDSTIKTSVNNITIGGYVSGLEDKTGVYNINMYGFRLYNRSLSPDEVLQNYLYTSMNYDNNL